MNYNPRKGDTEWSEKHIKESGTHASKRSIYHGNHIDEVTEKWVSLTANTARIPFFYTITKIQKPNAVGGPIISGYNSPTERI